MKKLAIVRGDLIVMASMAILRTASRLDSEGIKVLVIQQSRDEAGIDLEIGRFDVGVFSGLGVEGASARTELSSGALTATLQLL